MDHELLEAELFCLQEKDYAAFQLKLMPGVPLESVIGVRTPYLRKLTKRLAKDPFRTEFLTSLPHRYYEEDLLHSFLLSSEKDYDVSLSAVEAFLPYVNNWAVCDALTPKCFADHREDLLPRISEWLKSEQPYTVRFGLRMLMEFYLDKHFLPEGLEMASMVCCDHYYVSMGAAWYFATALAFNYEETLPYLTGNLLDRGTHDRTIRKAIESFRVTEDHKAYLKTLKR